MKEFILFGILLLNACAPVATVSPTMTLAKSPTSTLEIPQTPSPIPTITLAPTSTLESINGGWSTFHSSEYGFSFQYPSVYEKGFYDPQDENAFCDFEIDQSNNQYRISIGIIRINIEKTDQSLTEYANVRLKEMNNWKNVTLKQVKIGNILGERLEYTNSTLPRWGVETFFVSNIYAITIRYYDHEFFECAPQGTDYSAYWVYEQIINTLKLDK